MTTRKFMKATITAAITLSSAALADIAGPEQLSGKPKISIIGHTGQDPAPKKRFAWIPPWDLDRLPSLLEPPFESPRSPVITVKPGSDMVLRPLPPFPEQPRPWVAGTPTMPNTSNVPAPSAVLLLTALALPRRRR